MSPSQLFCWPCQLVGRKQCQFPYFTKYVCRDDKYYLFLHWNRSVLEFNALHLWKICNRYDQARVLTKVVWTVFVYPFINCIIWLIQLILTTGEFFFIYFGTFWGLLFTVLHKTTFIKSGSFYDYITYISLQERFIHIVWFIADSSKYSFILTFYLWKLKIGNTIVNKSWLCHSVILDQDNLSTNLNNNKYYKIKQILPIIKYNRYFKVRK